MTDKVMRLDFAHIGCKASILVQGMAEDESIRIGCFAYLTEHNGKKILIDTGIEDIGTVNLTKSSKDDWTREKSEGSLPENLKKAGVMPEEIEEVYLTHSHYDHISGLRHLTNAKVYMSRKEYEFLHSREHPHSAFLKEETAFLEKKKLQNELVLVEEEYQCGDIRCVTVGGHTPGSMMVRIGDCLFTGDAVFLLENVEKNRPIGFCKEPQNAQRALGICRRHKGTILTGHDYRCRCGVA